VKTPQTGVVGGQATLVCLFPLPQSSMPFYHRSVIWKKKTKSGRFTNIFNSWFIDVPNEKYR